MFEPFKICSNGRSRQKVAAPQHCFIIFILYVYYRRNVSLACILMPEEGRGTVVYHYLVARGGGGVGVGATRLFPSLAG